MNLAPHHISTLQNLFAKHPSIKEVLLFGSRALGTHKESSDIDIALKGDISPTLIAHLKEELEDSTLPYFCDIISYEKAPKKLKESIDSHALPLYTKEEQWQEVRLGEVVEIKYGKDHKHLKCGTFPTYGSGGIMRYVDSAIYEKESVLIPRKGTLNNIFYTKTPFWVVDTMFYTIIDIQKIYPKFLYYTLKTFDFNLYNVGSAVPSLTTKILNDLTIPLPPLERQREIAEILSSFDDKIDFLHRQNKTLESLTKLSYERIMKGRENSTTLSNIIQIQGGYAFKSKDFLKYGIHRVLKIKNISSSTVDIINTDFISPTIANTINQKFQILSGDILIAMTGAEVGKIGIIPKNNKNLFLNQRVGVIREKIDNAKYLAYLHLKSSFGFEYIVNTASGSAQANISTSQIEQCPFPFFSQEEIEAFSEKVALFFKKIIENLEKIQNLIKIRELVLPFLLDKDSF